MEIGKVIPRSHVLSTSPHIHHQRMRTYQCRVSETQNNRPFSMIGSSQAYAPHYPKAIASYRLEFQPQRHREHGEYG